MINNPILKGFHPDPCICRSGEDYYIATSTFEWFPGVRIFHSRDLKNWRLASMPLNTTDVLDMKGNPDSGGIWAPALSYADGKFWLFYTDVKVIDAPWKNGRNFLVTAPSIEGPWSEPIPMGNGGFDPSMFHADDGKKYYVYRLWGPRNHTDPINKIVIQEFDPISKTLQKERKTIFEGTERKYTEAPHIYKKDGYYYLLTAEGGTSFEHAVTVARSKDLFGPYDVSPNGPLITTWHTPTNPLQKAGHGSLVETQNGEWFITYLASRPLRFPNRPLLARWGRGACPMGRETAIDRIEWVDGWPTVVGGPHAKLQIPDADLPECDWGITEDFMDNFDGEKLDDNWQTLRIPFSDKLGSLSANPGHLRLYGNDSLLSLFEQSTVATRWRHHNFTAETKMAFKPENFQQSAGICCYYNTSNWTYCLVDFDEELNKRCLRLIQVDKQVASFHYYDNNQIVIPDDVENIWLKVDVKGLEYFYSYSFDGNLWKQFDKSFESWKISDDYIDGRGFFTGAFIGLHCEDISGDGCFADFSDFEYLSKE
ncbi:glycoside hydrolase family 43 protein [Photobacterium sp. ZSDE20]|uniref:Glycoside hydrolase family 43 protein n=1 Tax=Photobacterium pectinilyticum TaxID=2906793 RepID=A0ABT1N4W2_9GAMM|nr:glycoside hydrolase family 43 protein [Photobacterium sp. ZSDE20]MCQ1059783.1 glycoside hydrolase family 43 protein [Photobacterium sp. ZSDE20]MDD1826160.1 glycoside hydrolase family 43 protein [Photobacterium sp. ZSDE20]